MHYQADEPHLLQGSGIDEVHYKIVYFGPPMSGKISSITYL
jgi:hypothetical protein